MAEYFKQIKGKLVKCEKDQWFEKNKFYRYGQRVKTPYYSEEVPKCRLCGSELRIMKKGKSALILSCTNDYCITNAKIKGDNCLKAFLPEEMYQEILSNRKKHSYFDKNYLINIKGLTPEEAEKFITDAKKKISEKNKGKNNEYYRKKYGDEYIQNKIKKKKLNSKVCAEYWINKGYSEEEAVQQVSKIQKENSSKRTKQNTETKEDRIAKYGKEATEKFYREKSVLCIEYWLKRGYTEKYGRKKISEYQAKNSKKVKNRVNTKSVEYWLNKGYNLQEAEQIISDSQHTFSLEKCLKKYGEENGLKLWKERQNKWQKTLHENKNLHVGYSKISQDLFKELENTYDNDERDYIFYGSKNREFTIRKNNKTYVYDFTDLKNRKIIEFNGDIYHGNPSLFKENDTPNPFKKETTSKELWEFDKTKKEVAESEGFEELVIWENEYKKNKQKIIEYCKNFLLCKNQNKQQKNSPKVGL